MRRTYDSANCFQRQKSRQQILWMLSIPKMQKHHQYSIIRGGPGQTGASSLFRGRIAVALQNVFRSGRSPERLVIQLNKISVVVAKRSRPEARFHFLVVQLPAWLYQGCFATKPRLFCLIAYADQPRPSSLSGYASRTRRRTAVSRSALREILLALYHACQASIS